MKKLSATLITIAILLGLTSCVSTDNIPTDLTTAQLIQNAQNCYEKGDYKSAVIYYDTLIKRYGTNLATYVEAKYELGHIYLKTKKYTQAYDCFAEVLDIYQDAGFGDLPTAYKKLASIGIKQIPAKKLTAAKAAYEEKHAAKADDDLEWAED